MPTSFLLLIALGGAPEPVVREARQLLDQLVAVDTSHGRETDALEPIAAMLRAAGLAPQIVESAAGRGNLIARVKGDGSRKPLLLLAHVDVVPVEGQPWTVPPFKVTEKDGWLYGRGVNDDKGMAAIFTALVLELQRERAKLHRDVVLALTAGEETGGAAGVRWLVQNRPELFDAEIALNEGGGGRLGADGQKLDFVGLGLAEKTFQSYRISVSGPGGHSSMPSPSADIIPKLARALTRLGELRFATRVLPNARELIDFQLKQARPEVASVLRKILAGQSLTAAEDDTLVGDPPRNALARTTCVATMLEASPQDNVLPTTAHATVNCRILPGETPDEVRARLRETINDASVAVELMGDNGWGPESPRGDLIESAYRAAVQRSFPGTPVLHLMGAGATDSRFLRGRGIQAYGVSGSAGTEAESLSGHSAHGPDERRLVRWFAPSVAFLRDLVRSLAL